MSLVGHGSRVGPRTGAPTQLRALLVLRWQMARSPGIRFGIVLGALAVGWLVVELVHSAPTLDGPVLATVVQLAPSAYLGFAVLALIAPLTAGGGAEVVPPDQLVAYPVRSSTQFLGGLGLAPLNLIWVLQLLTLVALTSYLTLGGHFALGAITSGAYVLAVTVLGQALAWTVVGLRQTRAGRRGVAAAGFGLLAAVLLVVRLGHGSAALDASPTRFVSRAVAAGGAGNYRLWWPVTAVLLALLLAGLLLGGRACGWALRRPSDAGRTATTDVRRRAARRSALRELVAVDRASVWRAPALRRGGLVLVLLPGLFAASAALPWSSLIVLPGLVAAGAGLLFGINAFALDDSGALWLASLPHDPVLALRAKAIVLVETVGAAAFVAAVAGSLRSPGRPTAGELTAIVASGVVCILVVVALALRASVRRPHRAELRGPRDAVAPPGALAIASARLAAPAALVGVLFGSASRVGSWWYPLLLAVPLLAICAVSLLRTLRRYGDPLVRSRVMSAVAAG